MLDVSANGARIRTTKALASESWVTLGIEQFGRFRARVVWRHGKEAGIQFAANPASVMDMMQGIIQKAA